MNTAKKLNKKKQNRNFEPVLRKVLQEAEQEHQKMQDMFELMGWGALPDALKLEIKDDVSAMTDELEGHYSSCDPHVKRRREKVVYWVDNYLDDICSLDTAVEMLRVRPL